MSVQPREVKNKKDANGVPTGKLGTVYDVFIKYIDINSEKKTYAKKGFRTKAEAAHHENEMRVKLKMPTYTPILSSKGKQTIKEYLTNWYEAYCTANLRPSTADGYKRNIGNHIIPHIGLVKLNALTAEIIDHMYKELFAKGLSNNSVRYIRATLSVALEHACKYHYIEHNPAADTITKIGKGNAPPSPYTVDQMKKLMETVAGTRWEIMVVLGGLYGLRLSEIIGLRLPNIDVNNKMFAVVEQLPFKLPKDTKIISEMAPPKSFERTLPITDDTMPFFINQLNLISKQRKETLASGAPYYENNLLVCRANGEPNNRSAISSKWKKMLENHGLPHLRFHDLRHSAATNLHGLTGDFYTVGEILGHTLKGLGLTLGITTNLESVTAQYIDVRLDRKKIVLDAYHDALELKKDSAEPNHSQEMRKPKAPKKQSGKDR
jgi:integrase